MRFARVGERRTLGPVTEYVFQGVNDPRRTTLTALISRALESERLDRASTTVFLSVPIYVLSERISLPPPLQDWTFNIPELESDLGVRELRLVNDMAALGFGLFPIVEETKDFAIIHKNTPRRTGYPIVVIGVRTGLSALGFVLPEGRNSLWHPVQTEAGHVGLAATNPEEQSVIDHLRAIYASAGRKGWLITAQDVLSKGALGYLHQAVTGQEPPQDGPLAPDALIAAAASGDDAAQQTMQTWSGLMGNFARSLAISYGAWGGVFLVGHIPRLFLAPEYQKNILAFGRAFEVAGPDAAYMKMIPVAQVTHLDPYLLGLARFLPKPSTWLRRSG